MTQVRLELDDYTKQVLDVVKGKFGLNNRNDALNKFAKLYGSEFVEPQPRKEVLEYLDSTFNNHLKKHPRRKMTMKQLDSLLGLQ
ncbi:MAG: DUF2683 family protein [Patescibacteria group bacterium]|nr:DUF2683 family protein [Patescibacteria group bacterium]